MPSAEARRDPGPPSRQRQQPPGLNESDDARLRFAEMLRATGEATAEEKERRRLARECLLRG